MVLNLDISNLEGFKRKGGGCLDRIDEISEAIFSAR